MGWDGTGPDFYEMGWDGTRMTWDQDGMGLNCDLWDEMGLKPIWNQDFWSCPISFQFQARTRSRWDHIFMRPGWDGTRFSWDEMNRTRTGAFSLWNGTRFSWDEMNRTRTEALSLWNEIKFFLVRQNKIKSLWDESFWSHPGSMAGPRWELPSRSRGQPKPNQHIC